jgi:hypothetical protein
MNPNDNNIRVNALVATAANDINSPNRPNRKDQCSGNYKKAEIFVNGMKLMIENPRGSLRSGDDWIVSMIDHYGYIDGVVGADGDELDVNLRDINKIDMVTLIDQYIDGKYDETKVMIGYGEESDAFTSYLQGFDSNWPSEGHTVNTVDWETFRRWTISGKTTKPFHKWNGQLLQNLKERTKKLQTLIDQL